MFIYSFQPINPHNNTSLPQTLPIIQNPQFSNEQNRALGASVQGSVIQGPTQGTIQESTQSTLPQKQPQHQLHPQNPNLNFSHIHQQPRHPSSFTPIPTPQNLGTTPNSPISRQSLANNKTSIINSANKYAEELKSNPNVNQLQSRDSLFKILIKKLRKSREGTHFIQAYFLLKGTCSADFVETILASFGGSFGPGFGTGFGSGFGSGVGTGFGSNIGNPQISSPLLEFIIEKIITMLWITDVKPAQKLDEVQFLKSQDLQEILKLLTFIKAKYGLLEKPDDRILDKCVFICKICLGLSNDKEDSRFSTRSNMNIVNFLVDWFKDLYRDDVNGMQVDGVQENQPHQKPSKLTKTNQNRKQVPVRMKIFKFLLSLRIHPKSFMLGIEHTFKSQNVSRKLVIWSKSVQINLPFYEQDKEIYKNLGIHVEKCDVKGNINRIEKFDYGVVKNMIFKAEQDRNTNSGDGFTTNLFQNDFQGHLRQNSGNVGGGQPEIDQTGHNLTPDTISDGHTPGGANLANSAGYTFQNYNPTPVLRTVLQYGASIFYGLWLMAKYGFHFYGLRQIVQICRNSHKSYIPAKYV